MSRWVSGAMRSGTVFDVKEQRPVLRLLRTSETDTIGVRGSD